MKRTLFQILAVAAVGAMCSCSDFLDPYPSAIRSEEYILTNPTTMQGLIGKCYDYMAQNYNDNEGAYLDCATDNAVRTSTTDVLRRFAVGVTSPTNDPFETYWDRDYKGIYNVNMFLKDDRGLNMRYMLDEHLDELLRNTNVSYSIDNKSIILSARGGAQPQQASQITGRIVDKNGVPVIGATIMISGTTQGTTSGVDGTFALQSNVSPAGMILDVSFIGYKPQRISVNNRTSLSVTLEEDDQQIEAVVVTALGIKRQERAVSYNVQNISDEVFLTRDANMVNSLAGKIAGVTINASAAGVGGETKVVMRGSKSIEQSSNALYVIDGIPMCNFRSDGSEEFDSQGSSEAIADLNPEDIESMTVLSGAAAAALYGSDAANGAILITTKRGKAGQTTVTVTSNTEVLAPFVMPMFQTRYGTGDKLAGAANGIYSWGERLNAFNYRGYDPSDDYFQTGVVGTETVSFSTGNERSQTYASAGAVNSRGIIPNNGYDRYNFTFRNTSSFLKDKMHLDLGASYIIQKDRNMVNQGVYSNPLVSAYLFPRGDDWADVEMYERYNPSRGIYEQYWPTMGADTYQMQNPYWISYRNLRENRKDRYMINASLTYDILDWLSVSGRIRVDNSNSDYTEKLYASTNNLRTEGSPNGLYGITKTNDRQTYGDVMVNINKTFGENWSLQANVGASISDMRSDASKVRGPIAYGEQTGYDKDGNAIYEPNNIPNVFNVYNLSNSKTVREQIGWREQSQSVFFSAEVGFKGAYYLTVTGRNDWPSQLAGPNSVNSSFFYPSVGASVVLSEIIPNMPKNLSYVKLRASYASVGLAFSRFYANPTRSWNSSTNSWNLSSQSPLYDLKPERTKSFEVGLTMRFLRHFNFDISYYNTRTINQTFNTGIPASSMYSKVYKQDGDVRNRGFEMSLGYKNTWNRFSWDSNFTASANRNKIMKLGKEVIDPNTGKVTPIGDLNVGGMGNVRFILREGGSLGDIYSRADLRRDSNGDIYQDMDGNIFVDNKTQTKDFIKLGSVFPDANLAWRNDFRWRNFNFGFLLTARLGGVVYSRTQAVMDYYGVSASSADARDAGGIVINGNDLIDAQKWYQTVANGDTPQYYTYSATNVRLQEASIGYTIPRKKLGDVCDITLSIVGRNLWMLYNKAPFDPEAVATTSNYYQGIDYFMMPSLRSIGFNVRVKF